MGTLRRAFPTADLLFFHSLRCWGEGNPTVARPLESAVQLGCMAPEKFGPAAPLGQREPHLPGRGALDSLRHKLQELTCTSGQRIDTFRVVGSGKHRRRDVLAG